MVVLKETEEKQGKAVGTVKEILGTTKPKEEHFLLVIKAEIQAWLHWG